MQDDFERRRENECPFCEGCGYLLLDKDAYYYESPRLIHQANRAKSKEDRDMFIERAKALKGVPMQPLAVECPKCKGTGTKTIEEKEKTA